MRRYFLICFMFCTVQVLGQSVLHCGTDILMKKILEKNPDLKSRLERKPASDRKLQAKSAASSESYTIPIVFHILHLDGPENISDSQVIDAVNILNRDFAKQNIDIAELIPSFQSVADSTGIHFALATRDPNGDCTSGINHYYDTDTDWNESSPTLYSHTWDPTMYLNVYVVRTITLGSGFGAAGYTYFPGSFSAGDPWDAIVVLNNYFGSIGTGSVFQSRVLTHEVGHWLNLFHVFGENGAGQDCFSDDFVDDTPPTAGFVSCPDINNPTTYQLCSPGIDENFQNYMDYSYCCRMFTQLQGLRMRDALNDNIAGRDNLWSASNLQATGAINSEQVCIPIADFFPNRTKTCIGVPVTFTDASWNGQPTSYNWAFPSGNPTSSISASPSVTYNTPGTYSVTLTTTNTSGSSNPITKTNIITVTDNIAAYSSPWSDGFETLPLPNDDWALESSSGGTNWEQSFNAPFSGSYSAFLNASNNTRLSVTAMISPSIDISSLSNPSLSFQMAATELNLAHVNNLSVYISVDCQETWNSIYSKTGQNLITTIDSTSPFIPYAPEQWRFEVIPLSSYSNASYANFKFEYTRDSISTPSNVYIDDINITTTADITSPVNYIDDNFDLYPNPANQALTVSCNINQEDKPTIRMIDMFSQVVYSRELQKSYTILDVSLFAKGVYVVEILTDNSIKTSKKLILY